MRQALELETKHEAHAVVGLLARVHNLPYRKFEIVRGCALDAMGESKPYWMIQKGDSLIAEDEDPRQKQGVETV